MFLKYATRTSGLLLAAGALVGPATISRAAPIIVTPSGGSTPTPSGGSSTNTTAGSGGSTGIAPAPASLTAPVFLLNDTGGIYSLQVGTGATSLYRPTQSAAAGKLNAFAYDGAHDDFYYVSDTNRKLYRNTISGESAVLTMPSGTYASGTFFGDSYWTVKNNSTTLVEVNLSDPLVPVTRTYAILGEPNMSFGDIAVNSAGTVFGAAQGNFFRFDLSSILPSSTSVTATTLSADSPNLQIAFMEGDLYGVATDTDEVFRINMWNGSRTFVSTLDNTALRTQDAAGFVPEPAGLAPLAAASIVLLRRRR